MMRSNAAIFAVSSAADVEQVDDESVDAAKRFSAAALASVLKEPHPEFEVDLAESSIRRMHRPKAQHPQYASK